MIKDFTRLEAWKQSMDLAVKIHEITKSFPKDETYGLVSQMRRSALSVPSNIAEGFGRYTYDDKRHKYIQARGELIELMNHLYYSEHVSHLSLVERDSLLVDCTSVHKLLNGLITKMSKMTRLS